MAVAVPTLAVFIDTACARIITFLPGEPDPVLALESVVEREHRHDHFDVAARVVREVAQNLTVERIILAGDPRSVAVLRERMPPPIAALVAGEVRATRDDSPSRIVAMVSAINGRVHAHH